MFGLQRKSKAPEISPGLLLITKTLRKRKSIMSDDGSVERRAATANNTTGKYSINFTGL